MSKSIAKRRHFVAILLTASSFFTWCAASEKDSADLAKYDAFVKPEHRSHWAFQPVQPPAVPVPKDESWVRNPMDAFVLSKLETKGWKPAAPAERGALLRRVYLDLTGLPPVSAEVQGFLGDVSTDAFEKVVERLLASPHYGERWGRHWLDLVRYGETNGYEVDGAKTNVWKYRDYVIRAFNEDKPYNQFTVEQLAGDELPDATADHFIAAGYNRVGPWDSEPADEATDRFDQLDDIVSTTSQVFLGLTVGCARCHNHKFEPISALDYYRMVAVFSPLRRPIVREGEFLIRRELDVPIGSRAELNRLAKRDLRMAPLFASGIGSQVANAYWFPTLSAWLGLQPAMIELQKETPDLPRGYVLPEPTPKPPTTHLLLRGSAYKPGPQVEPGVPTVLVSAQPSFPPPGEYTSQRRLTLAKWIASPDNPLTARVIVNRVWQYHFGEGIVRTPSDFGTMGDAATHPELLDWLAHWFVKEGWSIKRLHKLILSSNTYRMSKKWNAEYGAVDPEDRLLWRFPYRRLEVEAIRDSILAISGRLNTEMYGPPVYPEVPKELLDTQENRDKVWKHFDEKEASRRTIYAHVKRGMIIPMLEVLDFCDTARTTAKRNISTVPTQALSLLNGDFVNRQAKHFADRLLKEAADNVDQQIGKAYLLALSRSPSDTEIASMKKFLADETANQKMAAGPKQVSDETLHRRALEQMCRAIFNLNEFVYPD